MTPSPSDVETGVSPENASTQSSPRSRKKRRITAIVLGVVLVAALLFIGLRAGAWLVLQDPLAPSEVMVVLSGHMPDRAMEAARLYREKAAPQVWVSQGLSVGAELAALHIPYVGEDFYNERVLIALAVPPDSIRILPEPSANTAQEVQEISRIARQGGIHSVIIVTSAPHTRRVRAIWNRLVGDSPRLIVRHPLDDPFDAAHWWRNTGDALDVVREWLGLANAWAGFPSQPSPK